MIWTTWRQHRAEAGVGLFIAALLAAALVSVGTIARNRASTLGLPACTGTGSRCSSAVEALHRDFHSIPPFTAALVAIPLLAGMFWGAPLVSREYEAGTHRLAWTQSVSPLRWIAVKIALIFGVVALATFVLSMLVTWTLDPLTAAFGGRYNSTWYDIQGIVPVACMLFALSVGVAASAVTRRTIPAMAVTLVAYAAARIPIHWVRGHFWAARSHAYTVQVSAFLRRPSEPLQTSFHSALAPSDWVQSVTLTGPAGQTFNSDGSGLDVLNRYCPGIMTARAPGARPAHIDAAVRRLPDPAKLAACRPRVANLSLRERITYQPASHFWLIQSVETAIFLLAAAAFVAVAVLAVARRRPA